MGTVSFEVPGPGTYEVECDPKLAPLPGGGTAGDILAGKQFYNPDNSPVTGTMPDNGAVDVDLAAGDSYTVPAGYHNGQGKVKNTASPLPALTNPGTAGDLLKDKELIDGAGNVVTGTLEPGTDTSDATASAGDILAPKTAYTAAGKVTGTIPAKNAGDVTADGPTVTVPPGYYPQAVNKTVSDPDLIPGNVKAGVDIFGVTGTFEGGLPDDVRTITLTADPPEGGTVSGGGVASDGMTLTVTAEPNETENYSFDGWKEVGKPRLPTDYTELEYIQSSGTQYIDIGEYPVNSRLVIDFEPIGSVQSNIMFGASQAVDVGGNSNSWFSCRFISDGIYFLYYSNTGTRILTYQANYGRLKLDVDSSLDTVVLNDVTTSLTPVGKFKIPLKHFTLFAWAVVDYSGNITSISSQIPAKLYSCKLYTDSANLIRDFVPCTNPFGDVGLYDMVESKFYANAGTGTFTAGPLAGGDIVVSEEPLFTFPVSADRALIAAFQQSQYTAGVDWWESTFPVSARLDDVAYGAGKFVALRYGSANAYYSEDGITWMETTLPSSANWKSVTYGNGKFVAVATTNKNTAVYSEDGITWMAATLPSSGYWSVTYGNGKFVAVSNGTKLSNGTTTTAQAAAYSVDGITWTSVRLPLSARWTSVTYGNDKFVAVSENANMVYSKDGITWMAAMLPSSANWKSVTYGDGKFVAVEYNGAKAAYSEDGITWTETTLPSSGLWLGVVYGDRKFVAVEYNGAKAAYSEDGITWKVATLPSSAKWACVTYGDGKFVAAEGNGSTGDKVAYSSAKGPGK